MPDPERPPEGLPAEWQGVYRDCVNMAAHNACYYEGCAAQRVAMLTALADAERRAARAEAQLDAARNKGLELASAVADARAAINRETP
jgi:hypothetical protein